MKGALPALFRLKTKLLINAVRSLREEPPLKTVVVGMFVALWAAGAFFLFYRGLNFINGFPGIGDFLLHKLFYLFSFAVGIMLVFSSALIGFPLLFSRRENNFLYSLPIAVSDITICKVGETVLLSAWAFVLTSVPLALAYYYAAGLTPVFSVAVVIYFLPLTVIAGAAGLIVALLIGRFFPRLGPRLLWFAAPLGAAASIALFVAMKRAGGEGLNHADQTLQFINFLIGKCDFARFFLLPSRWAVDGIFGLERGHGMDALFNGLLLLSTSLFFVALAVGAGNRLLEGGWNYRTSCRPALRRERVRPVFRWRTASAVRAVALKDILDLVRDAGQWGQFALFFGLLGIYILNLRNLPYETGLLFWRYLLFALNIAALGFTLAGLSSRFFFPLVSIELKRFWLLVLTPVRMRQLVLEKYFLCMLFTLSIVIPLAVLSGFMLRVTPMLLLSSVLSVICMGVAVSALSVGLGAVYPNVKANSPAEIISGLGGTMVLVFNLIYVCGALFIVVAPLYLHAKRLISDGMFPFWLCGSSAALMVLSLFIARLVLYAGWRSLERIEL